MPPDGPLFDFRRRLRPGALERRRRKLPSPQSGSGDGTHIPPLVADLAYDHPALGSSLGPSGANRLMATFDYFRAV